MVQSATCAGCTDRYLANTYRMIVNSQPCSTPAGRCFYRGPATNGFGLGHSPMLVLDTWPEEGWEGLSSGCGPTLIRSRPGQVVGEEGTRSGGRGGDN
jgi:hypothetical protein